MIHILGWPTIYMCAFLSRVDIHIPESAVHSLFTWPGVKTHVYIISNVSLFSLSLSYYSPNRTNLVIGFSSRQILLWWCMFTATEICEKRGGWWKAERDPPEPLRAEAKQCKDGLWKYCQVSNNNSAHGCL